MRPPDETADRVQQLDQIVSRIRDLAITRESAFVAISSMTKSAEAASRIGQLAKGSGEIDYAVDLLLGSHRPDRLLFRSTFDAQDQGGERFARCLQPPVTSYNSCHDSSYFCLST